MHDLTKHGLGTVLQSYSHINFVDIRKRGSKGMALWDKGEGGNFCPEYFCGRPL